MSVTTFDVLDRRQDVHRDYILEASAGTGKTFAIENIVVRLLLESQISLEQILVVTFTKAATRDLKLRVRQNILKALAFLQNSDDSLQAHDYLIAFKEQPSDIIQRGIQQLESALFLYDQAQIFTIHGFCARVLRDFAFEGGFSFNTIKEDSTLSEEMVLKTIRDFFRTELKEELVSHIQLKIVLGEYFGSVEKFEKAILKTIISGYEIISGPSFNELYLQFKEAFNGLKNNYHFHSQHIVDDFITQAPNYEKLADRKGVIKESVLNSVKAFAQLFEKEITLSEFNTLIHEGIFILEALDPTRLKKSAQITIQNTLHYPEFLTLVRNAFWSIVEQARKPHLIFSIIANGCQKLLAKRVAAEELMSFDDILRNMREAMKSPCFAENVRKKYQAAIVDEFQDTDPLQWDIFRILFPPNSSWGHLYLVGDPKQSIYAFRHADIYTYLSASDTFGNKSKSFLETNYRSQPNLVQGLNRLFAAENTPNLIRLPKIDQSLPYHSVKWNSDSQNNDFKDHLGSIHFCLATTDEKGKPPLEAMETNYFFPFITREIHKLHSNNGIALNQCAILVSDRFQAQRLVDYLQRHNVPVVSQRSSSLSDSIALPALRDLLFAILHPKDESALKSALGGRIFQWTHEEVRHLDELSQNERVVSIYAELRKIWLAHGFAEFYEQLMNCKWQENFSIAQNMLAREGGIELYQDLQQLSRLICVYEYTFQCNPERCISYLDELMNAETEQEILKREQDLTRNAVTVMTMHASKGLEFDVVFPLGLLSRTKAPELIIPEQFENRTLLKSTFDENTSEYLAYCEELDAEKMRQLYVAMTRGKYRLYLPVIIAPNAKSPTKGSASPMELFLAKLGFPECSKNEIYERIKGYNGSVLRQFVNSCPESQITFVDLQNCKESFSFTKTGDSFDLVTPMRIEISPQKIFMHSFTGMTKGLARHDEELEAPHDFHCKEKNAFTLPAGADVGVLLHTILESIDYAKISEAKCHEEILSSIQPYLQKSAFESWGSVISQMVYNALTTQFEYGESRFRLCDISSNHRMHEVEFLYPYDGIAEIEEMTKSAGFLKGFIDCIFFHDGKYYLLDWKSNWLGSTLEEYGEVHLEKAMLHHHYFLQAEVYKQALKRYLKVLNPRPFDEIYGGAMYLFLRSATLFKLD